MGYQPTREGAAAGVQKVVSQRADDRIPAQRTARSGESIHVAKILRNNRTGGSGLPLDRSERVATRRPASDYRRKAPKEIGQSVRCANYKVVQQRRNAAQHILPSVPPI